jgi:hypothetical protein
MPSDANIDIFEKTPAEVLDYTVDFSSWLVGGDLITGAPVWTVPTGLTLQSSANDSTKAVAWLSAGVAGATYTVQCRVNTSQGRTAQRAIVIRCVDRR